MKSTELAELLLAALYNLAEAEGHGKYYSLDNIAAEFGETDRGKVMEMARWLEGQGFVHAAITTGGSSARLLVAGSQVVEAGGETGMIQKYRDGKHDPAPFPPHPGPTIQREEVVKYLLQCKAKQWCQAVYQEGHQNYFIIVGDDNRKIILRDGAQGYTVLAEHLGSQTVVGRAETFCELEKLVTAAGKCYGGDWPSKITSARLSESTPATNLATISGLVGASEIQAVFDPYLENRSLISLKDILSFGGSISNNVRLLSGEKMTQGRVPRLTKTVVQAWFAELGLTAGEVRAMPSNEHRRFMLLSGCQSLILGMSLNSINKNEAVRLEPDNEDRPFFESVWAGAVSL